MKRHDKAMELFTHKKRSQRINCAQAILTAYHPDNLEQNSILVKEFKKYGHGKAPEKFCGAYYAADYLLKIHDPEKQNHFKAVFTEEAGDLVCKKIRKNGRLSCNGCVAVAARYLENCFPDSSVS